jgi:tetratricopeptide (TPR) repeat protein
MILIRDEGNTGGRPPRDPRVQEYSGIALRGQLFKQDLFGYAGDDPNPRPLPTRTLGSFKRQFSDYFQADPETARLRAPHALCFAFCSDKVKLPPQDAIAVPREDLWWLAAPNDLMLLSDRITHHYTTVHRVWPEGEKIFFLDDWPERIFLKEGLNSAGVSAEIVPYFAGIFDAMLPGRKEVGITRDEYLRVAVGLITQDTPALLDRYLDHRPQARSDYALNLSCGLSLLDVSQDNVARFAVPWLERALAIAREQGSAQNERQAAGALYVALLVSSRRARQCGDALAGKPFEDCQRELVSRYGEKEILTGLDIEQLCRLGNAAGWGQDFDSATTYLDLALAREPGHEGARWLRAKVRLRREDAAGTLEDATEAIAANSRRTREREAERDARDPRDRWGRLDDEGRLAGLRRRRGDEHGNRANALIRLGRTQEARADAEQAIALAPDVSTGHFMLALIEKEAGNLPAARGHLRQAIAQEKSARERANLAQFLAALEAGPPPEPPATAEQPS